MASNKLTDLLEEAVTEWWGVRCDDYDPDCPCCRAWEQLDKLTEFYACVADATLHHDVIEINAGQADHDGSGVACVTANRLGRMLENVDKEWWK